MSLQLVAIDTGPLGLLTHPRPSPEAVACLSWLQRLLRANVRVMVPSIADYELRREYLRRHSAGALRELDAIARRLDVPPISDAVLRRAAALWAQSRQSGRPTSDPKALDNDCILVAQSRLEAEALYLRDDEWTIATSDVGDLPFLAPAALWRDVIRDLPSI